VNIIKINENASVIAKGMIEIHASPEIIWDIIADIKRWPIWNPDVKNASLEGEMIKGSKFKWKSGSVTISSVLQEVDRPRFIGWTGKTMGIKAVHIWKLEPENAETVVRTEESWEGPLTHLTPGRTQNMVQKSMNDGLNYLKIEAERVTSLK
jgi:hypothetical protein